MKNLTVKSLEPNLAALDEASAKMTAASEALNQARYPYYLQEQKLQCQIAELQDQIEAIGEAMGEDPVIIEAKQASQDASYRFFTCLKNAKTEAWAAYAANRTGGAKRWQQDKWVISIRRTQKPVVTDPLRLLKHLDELNHSDIVKNVRVTLHKKATVELDTYIPLQGLEVETENSVTISAVKAPEEDWNAELTEEE